MKRSHRADYKDEAGFFARIPTPDSVVRRKPNKGKKVRGLKGRGRVVRLWTPVEKGEGGESK